MRFTFAVFAAMNLLNFMDRYAPSAVKELIRADLHLTDTQTGLVFSAFVIVYTVACPVFGTLSDRVHRTRLLAGAVALWSLATAGAALATDFTTLIAARALVGVGEAAFITISPAIIADLLPPEKRNRALTLLNATTPIGVALGFVLASHIGQVSGWRWAFAVVGLPGLLLALVALLVPDPPRGAHDDPAARTASPSWRALLVALPRNHAWVCATFGYVAISFALSGIGDWLPTFLSRERGFTVAEAGDLSGASIVVGGIVGTLAGGFLADALRARFAQPLFVVCAASLVPGTALAVFAIYGATGAAVIGASLIAAQVFLWMHGGPVNALIVNSLDLGARARAFGFAIMLTHALGDVLSPPLVGAASEATGSVAKGIAVALAALGVACVLFVVGARAPVAKRPAE